MSTTSKHPKALPYLFFSEMWERFGYYLMIGIFTLYLKDKIGNGGFGLNEKESADLYGTFIALVFFTPFLGGILADRYWGYKKTIIVGGLLMGIGYCLMGIHSKAMLYTAMTCVIVGNGLFKPNISSLLGNIYNRPEFKANKDSGYNIFYMGINVGAFICNFFGAALYNAFGWTWAFVAAGVGMFIGIVVFVLGMKYYEGADEKKGMAPGDMSTKEILLKILLPSVVFAAIGFFINGITDTKTNPNGNLLGSDSTDAFLFACIPVCFFFYSIYKRAQAHEKRPLAAMLTIFSVVVVFWAVFKQNGTALNTWADNYTNREVTGTTASVLNSLKQSKEVTYQLGKDSVALTDAQFRAIKDGNGNKVKGLDYPSYFKNVAVKPAEGSKVSLWSTNLSQSINPGWVILLTPVVVGFFTWLRRKKKEPSTPTKIALGLLISGLSTLVMVAAAKASHVGADKVSLWWLIGTYGVVTIGELMLSPMGLSLVSKMSPVRMTSIMMGGWFLATSIGNKMSGVLASLWDNYDDKGGFFMVNFWLLIAASVVMFALLRWLNKIFAEHAAG
ncbi:MAG: Dipeptide and tripeptide permease [Bacteroidota bacterium]|jgi:POT family proton-dependent oligopeptide transporter